VSEKAVRPPTPTPPQLSGSLRRSDGRGGGSTLSERRAAWARSVHHQRPSDASCDGPASSAQAGTTPSRSETHVGTWRCAGDSRGTTAPCVVAQLVRCEPRRREAQTPGATVGRCYKSLPNSILWLRATLLFTIWSRSSLQTYFWANVNKTDVAPARPLVLGLGRRLGGGGATKLWSPNSCARPGSLHTGTLSLSKSEE
jgi:hypothetical protein